MIVRGDHAERLFECGACGHSWRVAVAVAADAAIANDKDRSRPKRRQK
jgi:hypothetical protein